MITVESSPSNMTSVPNEEDRPTGEVKLEPNRSFATNAEHFLGSTKEKTQIEFSNLTLTLKRKKKPTKVILDNLSGVIKNGRLTALMGPSGSGKTS